MSDRSDDSQTNDDESDSDNNNRGHFWRPILGELKALVKYVAPIQLLFHSKHTTLAACKVCSTYTTALSLKAYHTCSL